MSLDELLGRIASLPVRRFGPPGAFLAVDAADSRPDAAVVLLPRGEVPAGAAEGDVLDVFVHLDSDDRPIATLRRPRITLGEVAFLTVTEVTRFGAFVDIGLRKDLLVPFAEQTCEMRAGERYAVGLFIDETGRLAGTMRVSEMLRDVPSDIALDEWIEGEAWRADPEIGVFVILERSFVGLVPASEPNTLSRGQAGRFRVANILPDGKIELSLRGHAHEEVESDARKILAHVSRPGAARVGDRSSPDEIRRLLGLSKKAFKRAAGHLLKQRSVTIDRDGFVTAVRGGKG
jgi:hypothetical protein